MLDTVGPELQIFNKSEKPIALEVDAIVTITPDTKQEASSKILPINYAELANVRICFCTLYATHFNCMDVFQHYFI